MVVHTSRSEMTMHGRHILVGNINSDIICMHYDDMRNDLINKNIRNVFLHKFFCFLEKEQDDWTDSSIALGEVRIPYQ